MFTKGSKSDYKKRAILFAETLKNGLPKYYKKELEEHEKQRKYLEKNL